jgi:dihydroorotate dehydrogenase electron transfer subunit
MTPEETLRGQLDVTAVLKPESRPARVCGCAARVVANTRICRNHCEIEFVASQFPVSEPGQFVQLQCAEVVDRPPRVLEWASGGFPSLAGQLHADEPATFLRRPFSIADQWRDDDGQPHVVVVSHTIGPGTAWLERLSPGDTLNATGPLGHGFRIPARETPIALVGGGVGIPPLMYLARRLDEIGWRDVTAVGGATTRDLLPLRLVAEPSRTGEPLLCAELAGSTRFRTVISTDDGSVGLPGVATDALRTWHAGLDADDAGRGQVFACGPPAMLSAVATMTRELGLNCQLCIERMMGCGLGTCLSCVVRVRDESKADGWRWALTCSDGPVFDRDELLDKECDIAGATR